jgi:hypothetical protein
MFFFPLRLHFSVCFPLNIFVPVPFTLFSGITFSFITFPPSHEGCSSQKNIAFPCIFSFVVLLLLFSYSSTGINIQFGLFGLLNVFFHIEFYSKIRVFFFVFRLFFKSFFFFFLCCITSFFFSSSSCFVLLPHLLFFFVLLLFRLLSYSFSGFFSIFIFLLFCLIWTSGLSFPSLIIYIYLVFALMSLRVFTDTARRFLMIIHVPAGSA